MNKNIVRDEQGNKVCGICGVSVTSTAEGFAHLDRWGHDFHVCLRDTIPAPVTCSVCSLPIEPAPRYFTPNGAPRHMLCKTSAYHWWLNY